MDYRVYSIFAGLIGLVILFALIVAGKNITAQKKTGSRWKRRFLAAGLSLLSALGLGSSARAAEPEQEAMPHEPASEKTANPVGRMGFMNTENPNHIMIKTLHASSSSTRDKTRRWSIVREGYRAVAALAVKSSQSTGAQRLRAKGKMDKAREMVAMMVKEKELTQAESEILLSEFERVERAMYREPPSDFRGRCYRRALFNPERDSLSRLEKRLPILTRLVASGKIKREVRDKVLESFERDIETLAAAASDLKERTTSKPMNVVEGKVYEGRLGPEERKKAKRILPKIKRLIIRLKKLEAGR